MSLRGAWRLLHRAEDLVLALALTALVLLAAAQIVLRMVFDTGLIWLDPLLRSLVLWVAMLGAMIAARESRHIGLDLVGRLLPPLPLRLVRVLTYGFAAAICAVLAWHALRMVLDERQFGGTAFASVPAWLVQAILPLALAVIALRLVWTGLQAPPVAVEPGQDATGAVSTAPTPPAGGPTP